MLKRQAALAHSVGDAVASRRFLQLAFESRCGAVATIDAAQKLFDQANNDLALGEYHFLLGDFVAAETHLRQALKLG